MIFCRQTYRERSEYSKSAVRSWARLVANNLSDVFYLLLNAHRHPTVCDLIFVATGTRVSPRTCLLSVHPNARHPEHDMLPKSDDLAGRGRHVIHDLCMWCCNQHHLMLWDT